MRDCRGHAPQPLPEFNPGPWFTRQATVRSRTLAVTEVGVCRPGQRISPAIDCREALALAGRRPALQFPRGQSNAVRPKIG